MEKMAEEVHGIKGHMKNMSNIAIGKPMNMETDYDRSKGIMAKIMKSMEYCKKIIVGAGQKVLMAKAHMAHFQQLTEQKGNEKIPAVSEILRELRSSSEMDFATHHRAIEAR